MIKKLNVIGLAIGIVILVCSYFVFSFDTAINTPRMEKIILETINAPEYESNKSYGGDAYTGMQQAAAQAANNLVPVFEAIEENNGAIATLNRNSIAAANAEAENIVAVISTIKYCAGFVMLSIGLAVISQNIELEIPLGKKEKAQETENCA